MRIADTLLRSGHLSEAALNDAWFTGERPSHVDDCAICAERLLDLGRWLDDTKQLAVADADAAFPAERLAAQRGQILRKLVHFQALPAPVPELFAQHAQQARPCGEHERARVVYADEALRFVYLNRSERQRLLGTSACDFVPPSARENFQAAVASAWQDGVAHIEMAWADWADGAYSLSRLVPMVDKHGVKHMLISTRDITADKRAEAASSESEARLRSALDSSGDVNIRSCLVRAILRPADGIAMMKLGMQYKVARKILKQASTLVLDASRIHLDGLSTSSTPAARR